MAKQPFTPDGVKRKTTELYSLKEEELKTQAQLISSQFTTWVKENFSLTPDQDKYFTSMDSKYLLFLSGEISIAVGSLLPIYLITPDGATTGETGSKRFETTSTISKVIEAGTVRAATGELRITISYPKQQ